MAVVYTMEQSMSDLLIVCLLWLVTQDTFKLRIIGLVLCLISIPATIYLPESPRLLAAQGKTTEL